MPNFYQLVKIGLDLFLLFRFFVKQQDSNICAFVLANSPINILKNYHYKIILKTASCKRPKAANGRKAKPFVGVLFGFVQSLGILEKKRLCIPKRRVLDFAKKILH